VRWNKRGLLLVAPVELSWAVSHAALPVPQLLGDGRLRLYFSARDAQGRSQIGRAELDLDDPEGSLAVDPEPVVRIGPLGAFDDAGATPSCIVENAGRQYKYYSGWTLGRTVPFRFFVGCAVSDDGGSVYRKVSAAPILERNEIDPFLTASPWVIVENGLWRMWYVSGTGWTLEHGEPRHSYHIKYAESDDGLAWRRDGLVCIDYRDSSEYAIARPCVIRDSDRYRMWFSARGDAYRICYAESEDGLAWKRLDESVGISTSEEGWDSEMQAYPAVVDRGERRLMLYNGNGYGASGIGWADLERD